MGRGRPRSEHYYMTPEQRREYHRRKSHEYRVRVAETYGRELRYVDPDSHPTKMSEEDFREYKRLKCREYYYRKNIMK